MKRTLIHLLALLALSLPSAAQARPLRQDVAPSAPLTMTQPVTVTTGVSTSEVMTPSAVLTATEVMTATVALTTTESAPAEAAQPAEVAVAQEAAPAEQSAAPAAEQAPAAPEAAQAEQAPITQDAAQAEQPAAPQAAQMPNAPGVQFKVAREGDRYVVYLRPTVTPEQPGLLMTAQVTIRVPHGTGADRFEVADLQSGAANAFWAVTSRVDAPTEAPEADILSFEFDYESSDFRAYTWQAGQAVAVFSFANSGSYQGALGLLENCDAFMHNTLNTNPGNQVAILGLNNDNAYLGAYESAVEATCSANSIFLPITMRQ